MAEALQPTPVLPYATAAGSLSGEVTQCGELVVLPKNARLPNGCIKCGHDEAARLPCKVHWHDPAWYVLILCPGLLACFIGALLFGGEIGFGNDSLLDSLIFVFAAIACTMVIGCLPGLVIYVLVALCIRRSAVTAVALCAQHLYQRRRLIKRLWIAETIFIALFLAGLAMDLDYPNQRRYENWNSGFMFIGAVGANITAIASLLKVRLLRPAKITAQCAWLRGAGPAYRQALPIGGYGDE